LRLKLSHKKSLKFLSLQNPIEMVLMLQHQELER